MINTSSINNKDTYLRRLSSNTNFGNSTILLLRGDRGGDQAYRPIIHFTLPAGSGTISDVKLYLYGTGIATGDVNCHQLTQTAWTELGATWDKYDGTTNWTTAGGDYSSTIIDTVAIVNGATQWWNFVLMGAGATNPLTLDWNDDTHLLLKYVNDLVDEGIDRGFNWYSKEYTDDPALRPYLEITYIKGPLPTFRP